MTAVMVALHDLNQPFCEISEKKLQLINQNAVLQINFRNTIHSIKIKPDRPGLPVERIAAGVEKYYQDNPDKWNLQIFKTLVSSGKIFMILGFIPMGLYVLMGLVFWVMSFWS